MPSCFGQLWTGLGRSSPGLSSVWSARFCLLHTPVCGILLKAVGLLPVLLELCQNPPGTVGDWPYHLPTSEASCLFFPGCTFIATPLYGEARVTSHTPLIKVTSDAPRDRAILLLPSTWDCAPPTQLPWSAHSPFPIHIEAFISGNQRSQVLWWTCFYLDRWLPGVSWQCSTKERAATSKQTNLEYIEPIKATDFRSKESRERAWKRWELFWQMFLASKTKLVVYYSLIKFTTPDSYGFPVTDPVFSFPNSTWV